VRGAARPYADVARGLLAPGPNESVADFEEAVLEFERLGAKVDLARCLLDLARAQQGVGVDPRPAVERAASLLRECDANLYLPEAEAALAKLDASDS